jgi:hypothetical protein
MTGRNGLTFYPPPPPHRYTQVIQLHEPCYACNTMYNVLHICMYVIHMYVVYIIVTYVQYRYMYLLPAIVFTF